MQQPVLPFFLEIQVKGILRGVKPSGSAAFGSVALAERGITPLKCRFIGSRTLGLDFQFGRCASLVSRLATCKSTVPVLFSSVTVYMRDLAGELE